MRLALTLVVALTGCTLVADSGASSENCANLIDDDLDGRIDCADLDCGGGACPSGEVDPPTLSGTCTGTWRSSREGTHCEPWGPDDSSECDRSSEYRPTTAVERPGADACVPIGDERCRGPLGLAPGDVYLDTGADPGGDGTLAAPFISVVDAVAAVADGGTIVFRGSIAAPTIDRAISFEGVCPLESVITGQLRFTMNSGPDNWVQNLTLENEDGVALALDPLVGVTLDQVSARGAVEVEGGQLTVLRSAVVGATRAMSALVVGGLSPALVVVQDSTFGALHGQHLPCLSLHGSDAAIDETVFEKCPVAAATVNESSSAVITHSLFTNLSGVGIQVDRARLTVTDSLVRRTQVNDQPFLRVRTGSGALRGTVLESGDAPAVELLGGTAQLEDVLITGAGVRVSGGALAVEQVELTGFPSYAIDVTAGTVTLEGLRLRGRDSDGGVRAAAGTAITAFDFVFEEPGVCGFELEGGVTLDVSDGTIAGAEAGFCVPADAYGVIELNRRMDTTTTASPVRLGDP